ncbi:hypothetical protein LXA43DRAFT_1017381 [Ganoderma leucocontextum]|nr:hypothetical protein LXA43DRAFT_1017381 [Ganoderma leucocontextum]
MATLPPHPFTYSNADIMFRSSDNVIYKLHKLVLSLASDFFSDMFELPQPTLPSDLNLPTKPTDGQEVDGLPVIPISEPSSVLTPLLLLCYPFDSDPDLASIAQVRTVLEAAVKYDLRKAVKTTRHRLRELVPFAPLLVYAIACKLGFEDDARDAAKEVHRRKFQDQYVKELEEIPFGAYHRLLYYCAIGGGSAPGRHFSFCHAATTAGTGATPKYQIKKKTQRGLGVAPTPSSTSAPSPSAAGSPTATTPPVNGLSDSSDYRSPETASADNHGIVFVASDGLRLRSAGTAILSASPALRVLATEHSSSTEGIHVPEPAVTMNILIRIYDPFEHVEITNLLDVHDALGAAVKYQMQKAIGFLRASLKSQQTTIPVTAYGKHLLLYAIACRFGMHDLALTAARATLRTNLTHTLVPDVDGVDISAGYLYRLLDYHRRCRAAIAPIFVTRSWLQDIWLRRVQNAPCAPSGGPSPFTFGGPPSPVKWACWYEPYMKATAASASWPSSTSVTRDDVLYAGLGMDLGVPVAATSAQPPQGHCPNCMHGKGAVELFQFSQHVASTITTLERQVNLIWPTI